MNDVINRNKEMIKKAIIGVNQTFQAINRKKIMKNNFKRKLNKNWYSIRSTESRIQLFSVNVL